MTRVGNSKKVLTVKIQKMEKMSQKRVVLYLILTGLITATFTYFSKYFQNHNISSFIIMWAPGIAAIITGVVTKRPIKNIGWGFSLKWLAFGWSVPILYGFVGYGLIWIFGLGGVPNQTFLERARLTLGMNTDPDALVIVAAFFYITVVNMIPSLIMALGEETGWRGFLVPELSKWAGFKRASWISGIVWGTWHLPGIIFGNYGAEGTPLLYQLFCFGLLVVSTAVTLAWLRMKSGSIWPVAVFHATHNGVIQMFFNRITYDTGNTKYFTGEFGIALVPVVLLFALYLYRRSGEIQG